MGDLIFVPELGLITGNGQQVKLRMWYPRPLLSHTRRKTNDRIKQKMKNSPFSHMQRLLPFRDRIKSNRKVGGNAVEVALQQRPVTMSERHQVGKRFKFEGNEGKIEGNERKSALDVELMERPITVAAAQRQGMRNYSDPNAAREENLNLPSLHQRPVRQKLEGF